MANYNNITASWESGTLSERMISRQFDDAATLVSFAGIPAGENPDAVYHLIVWMATEEGGEPTEQSPIQLSGPEWLISNYYTQFQQSIQFRRCIQIDGDDGYEAHSPIFSGRIGKSLRHDGETVDIDTATMFDPYKEYVDERVSELIVAAGDVQIDTSLSVSGAAADAKTVGDALSSTNERLDELSGVVPLSWTDGGYIYTAPVPGAELNLTPRSSSGFSYIIVNASEGDEFVINAEGAGNAFLWTFIDADNIVLTKSAGGASVIGSDLHITAPANSAKLVVNSTASGKGDCSQYSADGIIPKIDKADIIGNGATHRMVAGVIRNSGNGWEFIVDSNHQGDMNCVSVSVDANGKIIVDYSGINAKKVISFIAAPDETFASLGYLIGSSVGKTASYLDIYTYAPDAVGGIVSSDNSGNLTVNPDSYGINSVEWDSTYSRLKINHNAVNGSISASPVVVPRGYATVLPRIYSQSGKSVTLEFFDIVSGNKITELSNKINFSIYRTSPVNLKKVFMDANNIVSSNGNIWFMGIFET